MKTNEIFKVFILLTIAVNCYSQSLSSSVVNTLGTTYKSGNIQLDFSLGETENSFINSGNTQITQGFLQPQISEYELKIFLQGFYCGNGKMDNKGSGGCLYITGNSTIPTDVDSIKLSLIDPVTFRIVETSIGLLQTNGKLIFRFSYSLPGYYYLKVQHRNSVETWSYSPVVFYTGKNFDFSTSQSRAYGNNLVLTEDGNYWAIYSGDIKSQLNSSQDGFINTADLTTIEISTHVFLRDYVLSDITGDGLVEGSDYSLIENNIQNNIHSIHP